MEYTFSKNIKYGYFEVENKPSEGELNDYYSEKYFQNNPAKNNPYQEDYSQKKMDFINSKIANKYELIRQNISSKTITSFIDIGCGEGFALSLFAKKGIKPFGIDYSDFGIKNQNPDQLPNFRQGNLLNVANELIADGKTFDLLWVDNVLEHVIDPEDLVQKCYQLCAPNGFIIFEVPNDFSKYQDFLIKEELIKSHHWQITPDHLNYFSPETLTSLCENYGFELKSQMTDFPIELFLLNENSNYYKTRSNGEQAHKSRLLFEKYIKTVNTDAQIVKLYQVLLESGIGRQIIGLYQKK
jgi:2-polyprenyl-3-methyl-5-hydroxy-6-metoxy-1,4-benzoquinol methylase